MSFDPPWDEYFRLFRSGGLLSISLLPVSFCNKLTSKLEFEEDSPAERLVLVLLRWLTELASCPEEDLLICDPRSFREDEVAEDIDDDEDGEDEDGEREWGDEAPVRLETTLIAVEDGRRLANLH